MWNPFAEDDARGGDDDELITAGGASSNWKKRVGGAARLWSLFAAHGESMERVSNAGISGTVDKDFDACEQELLCMQKVWQIFMTYLAREYRQADGRHLKWSTIETTVNILLDKLKGRAGLDHGALEFLKCLDANPGLESR